MQIKWVNGVDPTVVSGREKRARLWRCKGLYDSVKNTQRNTVLQAILFVNDEKFFRTWCSKYLYPLYATVHSVSEIFPWSQMIMRIRAPDRDTLAWRGVILHMLAEKTIVGTLQVHRLH